jgi:hypothetical protein
LTAHETIVQAIRLWIRTVMEWTEAEAADLAVPVDRGPEKGRRPAIPFLTVDLALFGQQVGTDDRKWATGRDRITRGTRRGRVNIQGFGLATSDWLEALAMNTDLTLAPLTVNGYGEIIDISEIAGTHIEGRYSRDFDIGYAVLETRTNGFSEMERVISEIDVNEDLEVTLDVTLP